MTDNEELFKNAEDNLNRYWGYPSFREGQDEAIQSVIKGRDTLVLFPTGGGKSLCYQVPASIFEGVTIVISPLVALMQDQVLQLNRRGIPATFINSSIPPYEVEQRLVNARNGMYKLLYCAPERLKSELWQAEAPRIPIEMVAVDEAHCISEWGHDFRPVYREIRPLMEEVAGDELRWLALTATATPEVRNDILENLEFDEPTVISKGFERPNLKWWVIATENKDQKLFKILQNADGSGLIYGGTRRNCERLAEMIQKRGVNARAYHAGMEGEQRDQIQQEWIEDEVPLVIATSAFGMGIDKEDCRYVVHYSMPFSLEAYYQEAGRAGRDGEQSYPIVLFQPSDYKIARKRIVRSYPTRDQIQQIYDGLCDMLNLALGSEMERARPVSLEKLAKRAAVNTGMVKKGLQVMDQFGVVQYITHYAPQIGLQFVLNQDLLEDRIDALDNRDKAEFIDRLMRIFGQHAFHNYQYQDLEHLENRVERSANSIIKGLNILQNEQWVEYEYLGEQPLIYLTDVRTSEVPLRKDRLDQHREMLLDKLEYMLAYIETESCRGRFIRKYFGEKKVPLRCNNCDNCLKELAVEEDLEPEDLARIKQILHREPKSLRELKQETHWNEKRLRNAISYLSDEGKIVNKIEDPYRYYWINKDD